MKAVRFHVPGVMLVATVRDLKTQHEQHTTYQTKGSGAVFRSYLLARMV